MNVCILCVGVCTVECRIYTEFTQKENVKISRFVSDYLKFRVENRIYCERAICVCFSVTHRKMGRFIVSLLSGCGSMSRYSIRRDNLLTMAEEKMLFGLIMKSDILIC